MLSIKNKIVACTGACGSLGRVLVRRLLQEGAKEVIAYDHNEFGMSELERHINDKRVKYYLGDIRDMERLKEAFVGTDIIIHAAARKRMDTVSHNVYELADVNIGGTRSVLVAGYGKKIIFVSTDKAFKPSCIYGCTKAVAEAMVLAYSKGIVWRFGNFLDSDGSVFKIFKEQKKDGLLTICDPNATRFVIEIDKVCDYLLSDVNPGLHWPRDMKAIRIGDLAKEIAPEARWKIVGLRDGEKLFEELSEDYNSQKVYEYNHYYYNSCLEG